MSVMGLSSFIPLRTSHMSLHRLSTLVKSPPLHPRFLRLPSLAPTAFPPPFHPHFHRLSTVLCTVADTVLASHRPYTGFTPVLHRLHTGLTPVLHRLHPYADPLTPVSSFTPVSLYRSLCTDPFTPVSLHGSLYTGLVAPSGRATATTWSSGIR